MAVELSAPARAEQTRARYPDESGYVERDGVQAPLGGLRLGRADASSSCRPGRSSTRATGRCRSPTWRATAAWSPSTGAATAAPTARESRLRRAASSPPTRSPSWTRPAPSARRSSSLSHGAQRALLLAAEHPERVDGAVFICPAVAARRVRAPTRDVLLATTSSTPTRAGRSTTATTGCATTAASSSSSSRRCSPSRTRPSRSRTAVGWGLETTPETLIATQLGVRSTRRRDARARRARRAARCS